MNSKKKFINLAIFLVIILIPRHIEPATALTSNNFTQVSLLVSSSNTKNPSSTQNSSLAWWFLLSSSLLSLPVWLKRKKTSSKVPVLPQTILPSKLVLKATDHSQVIVKWEITPERLNELGLQGTENATLRLYDITEEYTPPTYQTFEFSLSDTELIIPITQDACDYRGEIVYQKSASNFLSVAKSVPIHIPASISKESISVQKKIETSGYVVAAAGLTAPLITDINFEQEENPSCIFLESREENFIYAWWELSKSSNRQMISEKEIQLILKIHDSTFIDLENQHPHSTQEYLLETSEQSKKVPINVSNRDYVAEIGYLKKKGDWISLAKSLHIHISES